MRKRLKQARLLKSPISSEDDDGVDDLEDDALRTTQWPEAEADEMEVCDGNVYRQLPLDVRLSSLSGDAGRTVSQGRCLTQRLRLALKGT